jgi:hypothetical protein
LKSNLPTFNGVIQVTPNRTNVRKERPDLLIIKLSNSVSHYYKWFIEKEYGLILDPPCFGSHISVLDGRKPIDKGDKRIQDYLKSIDNKPINISYNNSNIYRVWQFICMGVNDPKLNEIRNQLGFPSTDTMHVTLGRLPEHLLKVDEKLLQIVI